MGNEMKIAGGGFVTDSVKTEMRGGIEHGIVEGYIASKQIEDNSWPDKFEGSNVFGDSIAEHKSRGDRPIRFNYMHKRDPIGGFPISSVREDDRGLFGRGEIALVDERGKSLYERAKAGWITDFSIGFRIPDRSAVRFEEFDDLEIRFILRADILEGSLVDEPMNKDALVTGVKSEDRITIERLNAMTARELEETLKSTGAFSRTALRAVVGELKSLTRREDSDVLSEVLAELKAMHSK